LLRHPKNSKEMVAIAPRSAYTMCHLLIYMCWHDGGNAPAAASPDVQPVPEPSALLLVGNRSGRDCIRPVLRQTAREVGNGASIDSMFARAKARACACPALPGHRTS